MLLEFFLVVGSKSKGLVWIFNKVKKLFKNFFIIESDLYEFCDYGKVFFLIVFSVFFLGINFLSGSRFNSVFVIELFWYFYV